VGRAVLGRPVLLILDEAEAHLDTAAARVIDRVLDDHAGTALVVTHRRALVERADVVWCLQNGRVAEVGPPALLLAGSGPTARLFAGSQAEPGPDGIPAARPAAPVTG
jgi:ABC-type multidrug transport system fused ATPase/permease subunit